MLGGTGMLVFVIGLVISTFASLTKATFILGGSPLRCECCGYNPLTKPVIGKDGRLLGPECSKIDHPGCHR